MKVSDAFKEKFGKEIGVSGMEPYLVANDNFVRATYKGYWLDLFPVDGGISVYIHRPKGDYLVYDAVIPCGEDLAWITMIVKSARRLVLADIECTAAKRFFIRK